MCKAGEKGVRHRKNEFYSGLMRNYASKLEESRYILLKRSEVIG